MKPIYPYALMGALFAVGVATAATTTPVGYTTTNLPANQFSFVGLTLHNPVISAGVLDAEASDSVTDTGVDFSTLLTAGQTYILELGDGTIQEITEWDNLGKLNTQDDITSKVTPGTTTYKLRKASTIADIFGVNNSAGITPDSDGDYISGNDLIYVPTASGVRTIYYYDDGQGDSGWFDDVGDDAANVPLVYADGFYIRRSAGGPLSLVTTGEVKVTPTSGVLNPSWNYVSSVAPVGLTLDSSGLQNFITADSVGDYLAVDNVYIPKAGGGFIIAYYFDNGEDPAAWFDSEGDDAGSYSLEGGFLILNRGVTKPYSLSVPVSYASL